MVVAVVVVVVAVVVVGKPIPPRLRHQFRRVAVAVEVGGVRVGRGVAPCQPLPRLRLGRRRGKEAVLLLLLLQRRRVGGGRDKGRSVARAFTFFSLLFCLFLRCVLCIYCIFVCMCHFFIYMIDL